MSSETTHEVFTMLYPLYKEEVYRRREQMMKLTAWGATGLVAMLFASVLSPYPARFVGGGQWLIGATALVWGSLFCWLVLQHQYRHRLAKQMLIQLERTLGLYEQGLLIENQAIYPDEWQTAWLRDRSGFLYILFLAMLTALTIAVSFIAQAA
ncbi:MAG TPA: hypothetical protein VH681_05990 [Nitrospiraceae bacterium]|jgi:hypothetical protein